MVRKVRTPEGARYYGLPIGAPITADIIARARSRNGGKSAPKGSSRQASVSPRGSSFKAPKASASPQSSKKAEPVKRTPERSQSSESKTPPFSKPTSPELKGPNKFKVGKKKFSAPDGSRVFQPKDGETAYVIDPDGGVHVFREEGEVPLSPEFEATLRRKIVEDEDHLSETASFERNEPEPPEPDSSSSDESSGSATSSSETPASEEDSDSEEAQEREPSVASWNERLPELMKALREIPSPESKKTGESTQAQFTAAIQKLNGMDGPPQKVATQEELDKLPGEHVWRGASESSHIEQFRNGDNWVGNGGSGTGTYTSTSRSTAAQFGNSEESRMMEMVISPDAKIIDGNELEAMRQKDLAQAREDDNAAGQFLAEGDLGRYAAALGYDGYRVDPGDGESYVVLQNRSAVTVVDPTLESTATPAKGFQRKPDSYGEEDGGPDEFAVNAMQISPYTSKFLNPDGTFTEERQSLHKKIIDDFLAGLKPQEHPTLYMNGGGPASGKGTLTSGRNAELTNYPIARKVDDRTGELEDMAEPEALLIDPDAVKMQFPEVQKALQNINSGEFTEDDTMWAAFSHEESAQVSHRLHRAALDRGYNIIFDGTGNGSVESVMSKVNAAKDAGYRVEANYLYLEPQEGIARAAGRAARTHRVVPEEAIRRTYANLPGIFDNIKTGVFDKIQLFDHNVPRGEPANLIGRGGGDEFEVLDPKAFERYLSSGLRAKAPSVAAEIPSAVRRENPELFDKWMDATSLEEKQRLWDQMMDNTKS